MPTFKPFEDQWSLTEISQAHDMRFAFATMHEDETLVQQGPFVLCRDYMSDVIFAARTGLNLNAYGYDTSEIALQPDRTLLLIKYEESMNGVSSLIKLLNHLETEAGLGHTTRVFRPELPEDIYLIEADSKWSATPQAISLLTLTRGPV